jgi:hypothetical protein
VFFFFPAKETSKTSPAFASISKLPSKSVVIPLIVPFTTTVAPAKVPNSSDTLPEIIFAFLGMLVFPFIDFRYFLFRYTL